MVISFSRTGPSLVLGAAALLIAPLLGVACGSDSESNSSTNSTGGSSGSATGGSGAENTAGGSGIANGGASNAEEGDLHYRVDQFGYLPNEEKVAVIGIATTGFNAPDSFTGPGSTIEVRRVSDDSVVYSGSPVQWNQGNEDELAGDSGYWFDFSSVTTPGEYYLADQDRGLKSVHFRIAEDVYDQVLVQAMRTFFYQREGFAKEAPYADAAWTDGASHLNDRTAHSVSDKTNDATIRDVSGGWMDAGDQNKYVTFLNDVLPHLLYAYTHYPSAFTDTTNIPESGNGIPDVIDELDWELSYLLKMQDTDGGVFIKSGSADWSDPSPPSTDTRPRYYGAKCTSSTISFAAIVAQTATVYKTIPALSSRTESLTAAAKAAWDQFQAQPSLQTDCDNGEVKSGDADMTADAQKEVALRASYWLWIATGDDTYHTYFKGHLTDLEGVQKSWWGPYRIENSDVLIDYLSQANADTTTKTTIQGYVTSMAGTGDFFGFSDTQALYRAYMPSWAFHWGSTRPRVHVGNLVMRMIDGNLSIENHANYLRRARQHIHWMHGVNALSKVYLTNMHKYGAENDCTEIFHTWFADGTDWDSSLTSKYGPAPGYVPGGPSLSYVSDGGDATMIPPASQPGEKSYVDFNDAARTSWALTENSITYQAPYVRLLAAIIASRNSD